MSLIAANEESDPSVILNGFWVTLFFIFMQFNILNVNINPNPR